MPTGEALSTIGGLLWGWGCHPASDILKPGGLPRGVTATLGKGNSGGFVREGHRHPGWQNVFVPPRHRARNTPLQVFSCQLSGTRGCLFSCLSLELSSRGPCQQGLTKWGCEAATKASTTAGHMQGGWPRPRPRACPGIHTI